MPCYQLGLSCSSRVPTALYFLCQNLGHSHCIGTLFPLVFPTKLWDPPALELAGIHPWSSSIQHNVSPNIMSSLQEVLYEYLLNKAKEWECFIMTTNFISIFFPSILSTAVEEPATWLNGCSSFLSQNRFLLEFCLGTLSSQNWEATSLTLQNRFHSKGIWADTAWGNGKSTARGPRRGLRYVWRGYLRSKEMSLPLIHFFCLYKLFTCSEYVSILS